MSNTPNVVISDPRARRIARRILDVIGVVLIVVVTADAASDGFSLVEYTGPALAVFYALRTAFGLGVDDPNTPRE